MMNGDDDGVEVEIRCGDTRCEQKVGWLVVDFVAL